MSPLIEGYSIKKIIELDSLNWNCFDQIRMSPLLFSLIQFYFLWFSLIYFDSILFFFIQFYFLWFNSIILYSILFSLIQFYFVWFRSIFFHSVQFSMIHFYLHWFCSIFFDSVLFSLIQFFLPNRDKMNDSLHDFVFISESSARANLFRIALGHNTLNPANP